MTIFCHQALGALSVDSITLSPNPIESGNTVKVSYTVSSSATEPSTDLHASTVIKLENSVVDTDISPNIELNASSASASYSRSFTVDVESDGSYDVLVTLSQKDNFKGQLISSSEILIVAGALNSAPVVDDDTASVDEDGTVEINVLSNDTDGDGTIDLTSVEIVSPPSNGSVTVNGITGNVTYEGNPDFSGADQFTYSVGDDDGATSGAATVVVTVGAINDPPIMTGDRGAALLKGNGYALTTSDLFYSDPDDDDD